MLYSVDRDLFCARVKIFSFFCSVFGFSVPVGHKSTKMGGIRIGSREEKGWEEREMESQSLLGEEEAAEAEIRAK